MRPDSAVLLVLEAMAKQRDIAVALVQLSVFACRMESHGGERCRHEIAERSLRMVGKVAAQGALAASRAAKDVAADLAWSILRGQNLHAAAKQVSAAAAVLASPEQQAGLAAGSLGRFRVRAGQMTGANLYLVSTLVSFVREHGSGALTEALLTALRESWLLEHTGRLLLLLPPGPGEDPAPEELAGAQRTAHKYLCYTFLSLRDIYRSAGTSPGIELKLMFGRCGLHALLALGASTLAEADGGPCGLPRNPLLRLWPVHPHEWCVGLWLPHQGGVVPLLETLFRAAGDDPAGPEAELVGMIPCDQQSCASLFALLAHSPPRQAAAFLATLAKLLRRTPPAVLLEPPPPGDGPLPLGAWVLVAGHLVSNMRACVMNTGAEPPSPVDPSAPCSPLFVLSLAALQLLPVVSRLTREAAQLPPTAAPGAARSGGQDLLALGASTLAGADRGPCGLPRDPLLMPICETLATYPGAPFPCVRSEGMEAFMLALLADAESPAPLLPRRARIRLLVRALQLAGASARAAAGALEWTSEGRLRVDLSWSGGRRQHAQEFTRLLPPASIGHVAALAVSGLTSASAMSRPAWAAEAPTLLAPLLTGTRHCLEALTGKEEEARERLASAVATVLRNLGEPLLDGSAVRFTTAALPAPTAAALEGGVVPLLETLFRAAGDDPAGPEGYTARRLLCELKPCVSPTAAPGAARSGGQDDSNGAGNPGLLDVLGACQVSIILGALNRLLGAGDPAAEGRLCAALCLPFLVEEAGAVPLLGALLAALLRDGELPGVGPTPPDLLVQLAQCCVDIAAICPERVLGEPSSGSAGAGGSSGAGGSTDAYASGAWSPAALRLLASRLRGSEPRLSEPVEALAARLEQPPPIAKAPPEVSPAAAKLAAVAERLAALRAEVRAVLPPACSNPACVSLAGDSEAGLRLQQCGRCGLASYCCRECQVAHWKAGHKEACGGGGGGSKTG